MALDLFYFLSTLPTLRQNGVLPFSTKDFLVTCEEKLGESVRLRLQSLRLLPQTEKVNSSIASEWFQFENYLRNVVAAVRQAKMPRGTVSFCPRETEIFSQSIRKQIEDAMAVPGPLDRENALDTIRWKFLEELANGHTFDPAAMEIYFLKLQLLEKQNTRSLPEGQKIFQSILQAGIAQAQANRIDKDI